MSERTNVVWIMSDQHACFASGCYGHPVVRTPHIDALCREAMRFDAAYTSAPQCIPARDSMLSGRYPHWFPEHWTMAPDAPTAAHLFRQAGYVTAHVGKMHPFSPYTRGFDYLVDMGHYYDYLGPLTEVFTRGMDACDSGCGSPWMDGWYRAKSWLGEPLRDGLPELLDEPDHFEAFVARTCDAFLDEHQDGPFFLQASFIKPHYPQVSPPEYHALYSADEMELPATAFDWDVVPLSQRRWLMTDLRSPEGAGKARQRMADYYAATTYMDECLGRITASLKRRGLWDNTVVVYTADHGEMLYHHGLIQKFLFFEQSARVPLIVRAPGVTPAGSATSALADLTDLLPTMLSLCGVPPTAGFDGVDLSPVLGGRSDSVRDLCFSRMGQSTMVRSARWKLCHYPAVEEAMDDEWYLFDMQADPEECTNQFAAQTGNPDVQRLRERLLIFETEGQGRSE